MKRKGFAFLLRRGGRRCSAVRRCGRRGTSATRRSRAPAATFVSPLVSTWTPAIGVGLRLHGAVQRGRLGRRHPGDQRTAPSTSAPPTRRSRPTSSPPATAASRSRGHSPATAIPYNVPGITPASAAVHLKLSGDVIAKIYMGQITNWNDPAIKELNPSGHAARPQDHAGLPHRRTPGTTYNFTDYLAAVSPSWKSKFGTGQSVAWPTGTGASGSAGVAGVVANTPGAICYVDTAFAIVNKLHFAAIQNARRKVHLPEHPQRRGCG